MWVKISPHEYVFSRRVVFSPDGLTCQVYTGRTSFVVISGAEAVSMRQFLEDFSQWVTEDPEVERN